MILHSALHLFKEVGIHVLGHVLGHKATKKHEPLSPNEGHYLAVREQLSQLSSHHEDNLALQQQRLALEKEQFAVQTQLSKDYLAHLHTAQQKEVELRVQEIQANFDTHNWSGVLSRQEAVKLLTQTAAQTRLLMIVSEPDVSPSCPPSFQHDLGKEVRGKLKQFLEKYYPAHSDYTVEFFGKFFKSEVFDTEIKQIEDVLSPLHLATIVSDVTRNEVMFHLRLCFGADAPAFSLSPAFPWKEEHQRLIAEGMDKEDSLETVQKAIVDIEQLLAGMLADIYFLWLNPLHEPRLFTLAEDKKFPADWLETVFAALLDVQAKRLAEYEQVLRARELAKQSEQEEREQTERFTREQAELKQLYELGDTAYGKKNYREALQYTRKAVEGGYAPAQFSLGIMYELGHGVSKDLNQAIHWIRKAAEQGYANAQDILASMYEEGRGVDKNIDEALSWYLKAAEQNKPFAWICLGRIYKFHKNDYNQALYCYRRAAELGNSCGQLYLGDMYEEGRGVNKDIEEAVRWYRKAATQGDKDAQRRLENLGR